MRLEPRVLNEPSSDGARLLFRRLLEATQEQLAALEKRADPEALHDFRVALRRLRSVARSFRESLSGPVRGKQRRALRAMADLTNDTRDAEVQLAWLAAERTRLPRKDLPAVNWLTARLEARRRAGYELVEKLARRFRRLAGELERSLARRSGRDGGPEGPPLGIALAELLRVQLGHL
ncbi:MAG TPA: CHAD domain-containing protein, partial [Anaeromyxobacter sp.]